MQHNKYYDDMKIITKNIKLLYTKQKHKFKAHSLSSPLCLCLFSVTVTKSGDVQSYWDSNYSQPYFDNTTKRDITVTIGQTAMLNCKVRNLGDRAVSIGKLLFFVGDAGILEFYET